MEQNIISSNTNGCHRVVPGLFTFSIVCYRNWEYLTQTIDSVLMQDYDSIQLIVSDDGSGNFPIMEFEDYIEQNKRSNIKSYIVRESAQNEGTVRHLNRVLECVEGEFFMIMAADDTLDNPSVLSRYVDAFYREGDDCGVVMAQTAMYDISMTHVKEYFVWPDVIDAINNPKYKNELLEQLYYMPCIPTTSTCFRHWVIDRYTPFDTDYFLIEDYPFHIKLAEAHVKMHYENFVSARHRDGGISHGAVTALSLTKQRYYEDCIRSREKALASGKKNKAPDLLLSINKNIITQTDRLIITTGTGRIGTLKYACRYPFEFLIERSRVANKNILMRWMSITLSFLVALLFLPEMCSNIYAIIHFVPLHVIQILIGGLIIAAFLISLLFLMLSIILCLIKAIDAFPNWML